MGEFSFDASGMESLTADLGEAAKVLGVEVDKTLVEVGALAAETVKMTAKEAGSTSIPPTVKFKAGEHLVDVSAGSAEVPLAALWELGNRGRGGRKGKTFKHPVFGNRNVWVSQPRHKFMTKARRLARPMIGELMAGTYDRALRVLRREG